MIETQHENGIYRIHFNRPEKLNSFTAGMLGQIASALDDAKSARVVVLTGNGRAFCAGQDLEEVAGPDTDLEAHLRDAYQPVATRLMEMPCPTIAAVNGVAAGAGANMALICDLVIASAKAKWIQPFSNLGLIPDCGGSWNLPRLLGPARAMGIALTAEPIPSQTAADWGLIWKCVAPEELDAEVNGLAEKLAASATLGLVETRKAYHHAAGASFVEQLAYEAMVQGACGRSEDYHEGVAAFREKRQPSFRGK